MAAAPKGRRGARGADASARLDPENRSHARVSPAAEPKRGYLMRLRFLLCLVLVAAAALAPANARGDLPAWPAVFEPFVIPSFYLEIEPPDWDTIRRDTTNEIEVPALFNADSEAQILVSVRRKSSRALPSESTPIKVGLKVDINEFVGGQLWHGLNKLSLENGGDISPLAEGLAWNLHELASVDGFYGANYHAGLASWVRVFVNGELIGVYSSVEERDKQFLRNHSDTTGNRYFVSGQPIWLYEIDDIGGGTFVLEEGDPHSPTWVALCYSPFQGTRTATCATPRPSAALVADLNAKIEMQAMLTEGAVDAFTGNNDALLSHGKNYSFVDFSDGRKRRYYPWDLDAVFARVEGSIYGKDSGRNKITQSPFQSVLLNDPTFRAQYDAIMCGLTAAGTGPISEVAIDSFLDQLEPALSPSLDLDPYITESASDTFDGLRAFVAQRIVNVRTQAGCG